MDVSINSNRKIDATSTLRLEYRMANVLRDGMLERRAGRVVGLSSS